MIQSVSRALSLLQEVAAKEGTDGVGVRELARATRLKVSTAQNLLKTLVGRGFLAFEEASRKYRLGLGAVLLAERASLLERLAAFARPWVDALAADLQETVAAAAWFQGQAVIVDWRQPGHALAATHASRVIPEPQIMASGRTLLAWLGDDERVEQARRLVEKRGRLNLPTTIKDFLAMLDAVRRDGLAETRDVAGSGIGAVSAPVLDVCGRLVLAVSCSAPLARWDAGARRKALAAVTLAARQMSAALGAAAPAGDE